MSNASAVSTSEVKQSLVRSSSVGVLLDKSKNDENLSGKSRGWLNWLSLGMLGAGGTDDSSQFSGVVSDEVIKVSLLHLLAWKRRMLFLGVLTNIH